MIKNSDNLPCTTGTLSQAFHWLAKDYHTLHFSSWSSQCAPKIAKRPIACSQGNEDEKQIPHWEMRKQTLFSISYIDVLFRDLPVLVGKWQLGQLLCQTHRLDLLIYTSWCVASYTNGWNQNHVMDKSVLHQGQTRTDSPFASGA